MTTALGTEVAARRGALRRRDVWGALAHPGRAWTTMAHWALVARAAGVPIADILRYRRELLDDVAFAGHIDAYAASVRYVTCGPDLYVVVRATKPLIVVETGVASGVSSAHILRALAANGAGMLYSIDLPNVQAGSELPLGRAPGWIVPEALRVRWRLIFGDTREALPRLFARLGSVDMFVHDSDHGYAAMRAELALAASRLNPGGVLASDDTHLHAAWDETCAEFGLRSARVGRVGLTRHRGHR